MLPNVYKSWPKMISQEKLKIFTPLQKLPKNVGDLGKFIVAKGFEKVPKVQQIAQSGHTFYGIKKYHCIGTRSEHWKATFCWSILGYQGDRQIEAWSTMDVWRTSRTSRGSSSKKRSRGQNVTRLLPTSTCRVRRIS